MLGRPRRTLSEVHDCPAVAGFAQADGRQFSLDSRVEALRVDLSTPTPHTDRNTLTSRASRLVRHVPRHLIHLIRESRCLSTGSNAGGWHAAVDNRGVSPRCCAVAESGTLTVAPQDLPHVAGDESLDRRGLGADGIVGPGEEQEGRSCGMRDSFSESHRL